MNSVGLYYCWENTWLSSKEHNLSHSPIFHRHTRAYRHADICFVTLSLSPTHFSRQVLNVDRPGARLTAEASNRRNQRQAERKREYTATWHENTHTYTREQQAHLYKPHDSSTRAMHLNIPVFFITSNCLFVLPPESNLHSSFTQPQTHPSQTRTWFLLCPLIPLLAYSPYPESEQSLNCLPQHERKEKINNAFFVTSLSADHNNRHNNRGPVWIFDLWLVFHWPPRVAGQSMCTLVIKGMADGHVGWLDILFSSVLLSGHLSVFPYFLYTFLFHSFISFHPTPPSLFLSPLPYFLPPQRWKRRWCEPLKLGDCPRLHADPKNFQRLWIFEQLQFSQLLSHTVAR